MRAANVNIYFPLSANKIDEFSVDEWNTDSHLLPWSVNPLSCSCHEKLPPPFRYEHESPEEKRKRKTAACPIPSLCQASLLHDLFMQCCHVNSLCIASWLGTGEEVPVYNGHQILWSSIFYYYFFYCNSTWILFRWRPFSTRYPPITSLQKPKCSLRSCKHKPCYTSCHRTFLYAEMTRNFVERRNIFGKNWECTNCSYLMYMSSLVRWG